VIAAHFRARPLATSLLIVAFDGEERGLLGARAFVRAPPVAASSVVANINADMIGRDAAETLYVSGTARFPVLAPLVGAVARTASVRVVAGHDGLTAGDDDWTGDSDQFAFIEAGIPAVYVGVEDRRYHHRPDDEFETMMPAFYVGSVEAVIALVREFDTHAAAILAARR
jgi:Zn-dependent M28 family amino/carboxypeptidase